VDCVCLPGSAIPRPKIRRLVCSHFVRVLPGLGIAGDALPNAEGIHSYQLVTTDMDEAHTATPVFSQPLVHRADTDINRGPAYLFAENTLAKRID